MVHLKRKDGESSENFFRRFNNKLRSCGILQSAKFQRYRTKNPNRNALRKSAVHKAHVKGYYDFLKKSGQYDDIVQQNKSRR